MIPGVRSLQVMGMAADLAVSALPGGDQGDSQGTGTDVFIKRTLIDVPAEEAFG